MSEIVLRTPRLALSMWGQYDAYLLQSLHSTIETTRYLSGAAPWSLEKAQERFFSFLGEQARDGVTKYKVNSLEDGRFIGRAGFSRYGGDRDDFELGYSLRVEEWGKGYATELASALADWFFEKDFAPGFIAFTHPDNVASQRVLTKIGMRSRMPMIVDGLACPAFEMTSEMRSV
jgi:ribosomal-protein-alanine N-acetyltransferase